MHLFKSTQLLAFLIFSTQAYALSTHKEGVYLGILTGWQNSHIKTKTACYLAGSFFQNLPSSHLVSNGGLGGVCLGYDILVSRFLLGAEILGNFSSGSNLVSDPLPKFTGSPVSSPCTCKISALRNLELTMRAGYSFGPWLPFVKIGWGLSGYGLTSTSPVVPALAIGYVQGKTEGNLSSFVIGGGVDMALTQHIILGLSASVYFSGTTTVSFRGQSLTSYNPAGQALHLPISFSSITLFTMVELKYKFPVEPWR